MTNKNRPASRPFGMVVVAMVLLVGAAVPAGAQQAGYPGGTAVTGSTGNYQAHSTGHVAPKRSKQASSKRRRAVSEKSAAREQQSRPWSIEDALPGNQYNTQWTDNLPTISAPKFGRVPLESGRGSIGLATSTEVKDNQFSDGRTVPGLETVKRDPPSYVGLSVSVPNSSKSFPVPIVPAWGAPE